MKFPIFFISAGGSAGAGFTSVCAATVVAVCVGSVVCTVVEALSLATVWGRVVAALCTGAPGDC